MKILENNENIVKKLKENFGEDVNPGIKKGIQELQLDGLNQVNEILGGEFINSCFHPDEFGIGSYRVSSLVNQAEIADGIDSNITIDYLDIMNGGGIKGFPNVKLSKKNGGKNLFFLILEKGNSVKNFSVKEKIKLANEIFDEFLYVSALEKNVFNQKILEFFKNILQELGVYEKFSEQIKNFPEQERNLENKIISFLFREKILSNSIEIKKNFQRNLMQKKYLNGFSEPEMFGEFQNSVLSIFISKNFGEKKDILEEKKILNNGKINFQNSYKNLETIKKFSESVKKILEDENLGEGFFEEFFEKNLEKSGGRPVKIMDFQENGIKKDLFVYKENGEIVFYKGKMKNPEKIEKNEGFSLLSGNCENYNLSGNMSIFLMGIGGSLHIGSERGYRELAAESVEKFFEKKGKNTEAVQNYVKNVILGLGIFDTFDENGDNDGKNLAGSSGSIPDDMFKMQIIGGDFAKDQTANFLQNNLKIPEFNEEKFVNSFDNIFQNIEERLNKIDGIRISDGIDKKFFDMKKKFADEKNLENFLNLLFYSFKLEKILK
ncbi:hypothetical protein LR002_01825 [Candidatus Gracilibacteria bacterium]|nr:hypothetical protein [Candidatus Gracilibacteria bacterium]